MDLVNVVGVGFRLNPVSRKPGLSKTALAAALRSAGIEYRHLRALGNPKWNRSGFGGTDDELVAARQVYVDTVLGNPAAQAALDEVRDQAARARVALLCFEHDEARCHRSAVLSELLQPASDA
jgi:uncharacterized protein (DUF488 family)